MEINDANLQTLSEYLRQTLSPDPNIRRPAERFLESVEVNQNYPILLLNLIDKAGVDDTIRASGAIAFKNYVKRNWEILPDFPDRIHAQDRTAIKQLIVTLMLKAPPAIQKQLSDAVSIIGKHDFPNKWPELITEMTDKFATGDFHIINGVLHTAHSLFKRYRFEFKSQELWVEIKYVLDRIAKPLTDLLEATMNLTTVHAGNQAALKVIYGSLVLVCKVFLSLNSQDLPEFFEDNMKTWMTAFHTMLTTDVPCLHTGDAEEAGVLEQLRSEVCNCLAMYALKYDEEFGPYMPQFVTAVWGLLVGTGIQPKYDSLVSNALQFLATVAARNHYKHLFEDPNVLSSICEKVIIPNMDFRESDEELFAENAEEYIRRDIEGSDVDTRRRAACDLVRVLSANFEAKIFEIFGQYLQVMLEKYSSNPQQNWKAKDAALYLVTSLASRGATQKHGVTSTSELVSIPQFYKQHVAPELERPDVNALPVLKADALRYLMTFRAVLGAEVYTTATISHVIRHLSSNSVVIHTYAASTLEKSLIMRDSNGQPLLSKAHLAPVAGDLLSGLFGTLSHEESQENDYVMKAIMRSFSTLQEAALPFMGAALPRLTKALETVARNPSRPHFNHYLFETLCLAIKIVCKSDNNAITSFEEALFPLFEHILQQDVQEFIPYTFQMLSLLLELRAAGTGVPPPYMALFPCLLTPALWDKPGNVKPLMRLLCAFISKAANVLDQQQKLNGLLGVFQKMIASKVNDHEGFYLLQNLLIYYPMASLEPTLKQVFLLLFQRLSSTKTTKFVRGLIVWFSLFCARTSPDKLINIVDSIQAQMFGMVLQRVLITDLQRVSGALEIRLVAVGTARLLCESSEMITGQYRQYWKPLMEALVQLFELPADESLLPDDHYVEIEDTPGYQVAYSQLNYAAEGQLDPLPDVKDPVKFLAESLGRLSASNPAIVRENIMSLSPNFKLAIEKYLSQSGVQIA
ncbi:exportin-2 [Ctenocephalides felis]|uniref:exportin-2 n=1 Tax=Ctenocephalides felis TaxID=7515 RepID=UPI000E6E2198|nr:exportin-2 [Ctenocephalides felis]